MIDLADDSLICTNYLKMSRRSEFFTLRSALMKMGLPLLRQYIPSQGRHALQVAPSLFATHATQAAGTFMRSRKKTVNPIGLQDITIVDDAKMRKAITAAAL